MTIELPKTVRRVIIAADFDGGRHAGQVAGIRALIRLASMVERVEIKYPALSDGRWCDFNDMLLTSRAVVRKEVA